VYLETDGGRAAWAYAQLGPGRVQVEFSRLAELGEPADEIDDADDSDEIDDSDDIDDEEDVEDEER
ncbi:ribosome maturation factor RimP, partial [Micromonospora sp. M51]|nr:ribosome maturation factor RimP [Micromonospora sp. M51]